MDTDYIHSIEEMLRDDYLPRLQEQLQITTNALLPYVTIQHCHGKRWEMNGIGKTELKLRTKRLEDKEFDELSYLKRFMNPAFLAKSLIMSEDDLAREGAFAANMSDMSRQLVHAAKRMQKQIILGVKYDPVQKHYVVPTLADATGAAGGADSSPYSSNDTYLGGVMGVCYKGENGVTPEEMPLQPVLADGSLATDYFTQYDTAGNIDMLNTNVIPASYVQRGKPVLDDLTIEKIRGLREALETRDAITSDEMFVMCITPRQKSSLIMLDKLQDGEYGFQSLKDGMVSEILGVRFIVSNMVPMATIGGKKVRICPAWRKESVAFGIWKDTKLESYRLNQRKYDGLAVDCQAAFGAARLRKEDVIMVHCLEDSEAA